MKHRSSSTRLATRQRKLSRRVSGVSRSCRRGSPETANKPSSRNPLPAYHEAEQFEMTALLASLSAPGKRLFEGVSVKPGTALPGNKPNGKIET